MKRMFALGLTTVLVLPVVSMAAVFAEDTTTNTTTSDKTTTTTTADQSATNSKELQSRIEARKTEQKTKLTNAEKLRITGKCKAAQGLVSSVRGRVKGIETSRTEVYSNIVTHLSDLSIKMKNKNVDTTALDADITTLKTDITTFNTDLATYKQDVSDLSDMDCKTDPIGFKASLDAARAALLKVNQDSAAIRTYVTNTIKPLLVQIRAQLETKDAAADKTTNTQGGQ